MEKMKVKTESESHVSDSLRLPGLYCPWNSPGQNTEGMEPRSPSLQADSLPAEPPRKPKEAQGRIESVPNILGENISKQ